MLKIDGCEYNLSVEEEQFLISAFGRAEGNTIVVEPDHLFQHVKDGVSPFIRWPDKMEFTPVIYNGNRQHHGLCSWWFCCNYSIVSHGFLHLPVNWIFKPDPTMYYPVLHEYQANIASIVALAYVKKNYSLAKHFLLGGVGTISKELGDTTRDDDDALNQTQYFTTTFSTNHNSVGEDITKLSVIMGALLHIGGQEFATAILLTSSNVHVQGFLQQWLGVFGG